MSCSKRMKVDNGGDSPSNSIISVETSFSDVEMSNEQYINKSYHYVKEVYDSFITKLFTYYSMYSEGKCDDEDSAPVTINDENITNTSEAVKEAKNKLSKVVDDFYQVEDCFMFYNIMNWVLYVHFTPSSSKNTLLESAFSIFYTYDLHLKTDNDLLKYANEAADNILKYIVKPGSHSNFDKDSIVKFVTSPTANNTSNIIELSFGKLFMLFGRSTEEEKQAYLYTGATIRNHIPETEDFKNCLEQLKVKFNRRKYNESELKTKIDGAAFQAKEALKKIEKKCNLKSAEQFIHQIDNFKSTMENERKKKEVKRPEGTPGSKNVHNDISHNKKINNLTMNM